MALVPPAWCIERVPSDGPVCVACVKLPPHDRLQASRHKAGSGAAEFLVLGHLLLERIIAFKAYVNFPGYDLIAANADRCQSARIQVKSRYRTDCDGFIINNFNCDFVVFVALNRGFVQPKRNGDTGVKAPEFYVMPVA
jgi:hypothetical protein